MVEQLSSKPRCKHPNAFVANLKWSRNNARIDCPDCDLVLIAPREPWVSRHACRRTHSAPKWAQKLIDAAIESDRAVDLIDDQLRASDPW